jgi:hypothetical protein
MGALCTHKRATVLEGYGASDRSYADFRELSPSEVRRMHLRRNQAMYAYILRLGRGFSEGVCAPSNATAHFRDPTPPYASGSMPAPCLRTLVAANLYSLSWLLCLANKLRSNETHSSCPIGPDLCSNVDTEFRESTFHALR